MRVHPLVPGLLLVAGFAVYALSAASTTPPPPAPPAAEQPDDAPDQPEPAADADATGAAAAALPAAPDAESDTDADSGPERTSLEVTAVEAAPGPRIRVLRGEPPAPAPGIEVAWVERSRGRDLLAALGDKAPANSSDYDLPLRFGAHARTDAEGTLQLPALQAESVVAAADPQRGEFGAAFVRPGQRFARLLLAADEEVRLLVRGPGDAPARGVPVVLGQGTAFGAAEQVWSGATAADGTAVARHFQLARRAQRPNERFGAAIAAPLPVPVAVEFAGRPAARDVIELRLPAAMPLQLAVVHQSGAPLLCGVALRLVPVRPKGFALAPALPRQFDARNLWKPPGEAPAVLDPAGPGLELLPVLYFPAVGGPVRLPSFRLPEAPVPVAQARLTLPAEFTVLAGTAVLADGAPLAGADLQLALGADDRRGAEFATATLPDGRFDCVVRPRGDTLPLQLELRWNDAQGAVHGARLPLGPLYAGERRDLGRVRLLPLPLLARGFVHDDLGQPVGGAAVRVQRFTAEGGREQWNDLPLLRATAAPDGTFAIAALPPGGALRLAASAGGHLPASSPAIAPGAAVDLLLPRVGVLRGRILLPGFLAEDAATLHLQPQDGAGAQRDLPLRRRDGWFRAGNLVPGVYAASVKVRNLPEPLCELSFLRIGPGDNEDPRLLPLDLRLSLFRYRLRAIGPGGVPLTGLEGPILWRTPRPAGETTAVAFRWQKGRAELVTPAPLAELVLLAQGYAPLALTLPPGDHDVFMQPLQPALVDLPGVRAIVGPDRAVRVSMIYTGDTGLPEGVQGVDQRSGQSFAFPRWMLGKSGGGWLDAYDRAAAVLSRNGPHEVVLRVYAGSQREGRQASMTLGVVDVVLDGPSPDVHTLAVDPQKLQALLGSLGGQRARRPDARSGR